MKHITILTGAGVSAESGLATFRDPDGIWARFRIEDVATPEGFSRDPDQVHAFYNARRRELLNPGIGPNDAHHALARLQRSWPGLVSLITQNIDDLHERAGSETVIHMHGELFKARCSHCGKTCDCKTDLTVNDACSSCGAPGRMRPHVVWFGEIPLFVDTIESILKTTDLFLAVGTSGNVYPAAGYAATVKHIANARTVEFNLETTEISTHFDAFYPGPASETVSAYVEELLADASPSAPSS